MSVSPFTPTQRKVDLAYCTVVGHGSESAEIARHRCLQHETILSPSTNWIPRRATCSPHVISSERLSPGHILFETVRSLSRQDPTLRFLDIMTSYEQHYLVYTLLRGALNSTKKGRGKTHAKNFEEIPSNQWASGRRKASRDSPAQPAQHTYPEIEAQPSAKNRWNATTL